VSAQAKQPKPQPATSGRGVDRKGWVVWVRENGDKIDVHSFNGGDVETTKEWEKLDATIFPQ
jgi:hypothetical protein